MRDERRWEMGDGRMERRADGSGRGGDEGCNEDELSSSHSIHLHEKNNSFLVYYSGTGENLVLSFDSCLSCSAA
eukprot:scaffold42042_cov350-Skeletonema_marinoi.AAC.1